MNFNQKSILIEKLAATQGTLQGVIRAKCEHPEVEQLLKEEIERLQSVLDLIKD